MSSGNCQHCGCSEIDVDPARGDAVCTNCGSVLEDNIIVSEVQFEENSHGGARAVGQLVTSEGQTPGLSLGLPYGTGKDSRTVTMQNARRRIVQVCEQLRLGPHYVACAYNFYKIALHKRFTRGRKNSSVIAACIYLVCRVEGTPHMLLDLSDIVQVNVYELGKTYLRLSNCLRINIPFLDPCLYITRFAHRLEFGSKTRQVSMTASRLVQRMKRDWMHMGRRPSGLCGAALLVAARLHDFSRTVGDVIKIVKVCEATLRKRLVEFSDTPSSRLTLDEFMNIDLEEEEDPPCFKEARRKQKLQQLEENEINVADKITELQKLIEKELDKKRKIRGPYSKYSKLVSSDVENVSDNDIAEQFIVNDTLESIQEFVDDDISAVNLNHIEKTDKIIKCEETKYTDNLPITSFRPTAASLGLKESIEECMRKKEIEDDTVESGELDLTGLDDDELDSYLMTEKEVTSKTDLWLKINAEYLREQKEKEEKRAKEEEENANKTDQKKRKRQVKKRTNIQANNTREALEMMIQEKKLSRKINYDVLENLCNKDVKSIEIEKQLEEPVVKPKKRKSKLLVKGGEPSDNIKGVMSSIFKGTSWRESALPIDDDDQMEEISVKKEKKDIVLSQMEEISTNPILIEEIIEKNEQSAEEELEDIEDFEEEQQEHLTAAQLLDQHYSAFDSQHEGESYYSGGEEEYYD